MESTWYESLAGKVTAAEKWESINPWSVKSTTKKFNLSPVTSTRRYSEKKLFRKRILKNIPEQFFLWTLLTTTTFNVKYHFYFDLLILVCIITKEIIAKSIFFFDNQSFFQDTSMINQRKYSNKHVWFGEKINNLSDER